MKVDPKDIATVAAPIAAQFAAAWCPTPEHLTNELASKIAMSAAVIAANVIAAAREGAKHVRGK